MFEQPGMLDAGGVRAPEQAHPDVPVVERMEDLWRVSKLQRERKARAQAQQATRPAETDQAHAPQAPAAADEAGAAEEDPCAAAADGTELGKEAAQKPGQNRAMSSTVQLAEEAPAMEAGGCQEEHQSRTHGAPVYDDLD
jgi:hypothetical protein